MSVDDRDLAGLEYFARRIRQDTPGCTPWDGHGTHVIFARELKGKHLLTALELVLAHASDPEAKTPAAITRAFTPDPASAPKPPPPKCPDHRDELAPPYCRIHNTEPVRHPDDPEPVVPEEFADLSPRDAAFAAGGYRIKPPTEEEAP